MFSQIKLFYCISFSVLIILCLCNGFCGLGISMLGPVQVVVKFVGACDNPEKYLDNIFIERRKFNRSHDVLTMRVDLNYDVDENIRLYMHAWKWGDGGYKPNFFKFENENSCQFMKKWIGSDFKQVLQLTGRGGDCPIKKGNFVMDRYPFSMKPPQVMMYGDFKVEISLKRGDEDLACIQAKVIVKPKTK